MNKTTKVTIRADKPTAMSSTSFNANINSMAFNMDLIDKKDHRLALQIIALYEKAHKLK